MLTSFSARRAVAVTLGLVLLSAVPALSQGRQSAFSEETWKLLVEMKWVGGPQRLDQIADPNVRIALAYREVVTGRLTPQDFYKEMSKVDLGGRQLREALVEVKTRLLDVLGAQDAQHFLGEIYVQDASQLSADPSRSGAKPALGSAVEDLILDWRGGLAEGAKQRVMRRLAREFGSDAKFSAFLCDIGSQPKGRGQKTFAGDIDINLLTAHPEIGRRFLQMWDEEIRAATNLGATEIDVVATVFGMSGPEVYPAEAGRIKALELVLEGQAGNIRRVDLATGELGETVTGRQAMTEVGLQGGLAGVEITESGEFRLPEKGPALVLDMARHLHRDVLKSMQFEDLDTLMKIAKFVDRASAEALKGGRPLDAATVRFSKDLLAAKADGDYVRATQVMKDFFGDRLPLDVSLGRSRDGKSPSVVAANRKFLQDFGQRCFDDLVSSAKTYLADEVKTLRGRMRLLEAGMESPKAIGDDLARLRMDMEVERLVLEHPTEGVPAIDPELKRMVEDLNGLTRTFFHDNWEKALPDHLRKQLKFVRELAEQNTQTARELAAATITHPRPSVLQNAVGVADGVAAMLDSLDDRILGPLRGEGDWRAQLFEAHQVSYAARARSLGVNLPDNANRYLSDLQTANLRFEKKINGLLYDNFLARRIQQANRSFGASMNSSSVGQAMGEGLKLIKLADELPQYWNAFDKPTVEEGVRDLATQFFENRVPLGSTVTHVTMGNMGLACWDLFTTILPPVAMGQTAFGIGQSMGSRAWQFFWSTELDRFTDELYAGATWEMTGVRRVGMATDLQDWKLKTVTYKQNQIELDSYIAEKRRQIEKMQAALRVPFKDRRFPYESVSADPFLGWTGANDILRENLARADNVLLIYEEYRNNPIAGAKLRDDMHQRWTHRWEVVKVAFLEKLIDQLQRRRANRGAGFQRLAELLLELDAVTGKLRVRDHVRAALEEEIGSSGVLRAIRWWRDQNERERRESVQLPDLEDEYEKATRITSRYLEVYDTVLKARTDAEGMFAGDGNPAEDSGLRILSTPYLLACKADADQRGYPELRRLPEETRTAAHDELREIKARLASGAQLDAADGSFDQRTLRGVTYHDVFKQLWKGPGRERRRPDRSEQPGSEAAARAGLAGGLRRQRERHRGRQ